jgi:hypothetical protein
LVWERHQACTGRGIQGGRRWPQAAHPVGGPPPKWRVRGYPFPYGPERHPLASLPHGFRSVIFIPLPHPRLTCMPFPHPFNYPQPPPNLGALVRSRRPKDALVPDLRGGAGPAFVSAVRLGTWSRVGASRLFDDVWQEGKGECHSQADHVKK